jgi:hypothetical protein
MPTFGLAYAVAANCAAPPIFHLVSSISSPQQYTSTACLSFQYLPAIDAVRRDQMTITGPDFVPPPRLT